MKNNKYLLNTLLTAVVFTAMMAMLLIRVFNPAGVLPKLDIPNMVLLSLVALLLEYCLAPGAPRCYICIPAMSFLTFALLPLMAGFACQHDFWKYGLVGAVTFTVVTWCFTSMTDRLSSGPEARAAAPLSALGLYLAFQCFAGMIL